MPEPFSVALTRIGGPPELTLLLIEPSEDDLRRGLEAWAWIGLEGITAVAVSAFGDVFFLDAAGAIHQLDTIEGRLTKVADTLAHFTAQLQDVEGRDALLLGGLVIGARNRGLLLGAGECYDFKLAPILGGEISSDAMQTLYLVVKLHIAGQIHEQVKDLPDGFQITGIEVID